MTNKEIAKAYIKTAEKCIKQSKDLTFSDFMSLLSKQEIEQGVCHFVYENLKIKRQIKSLNKKEYFEKDRVSYWTTPIYYTKTKKQAINALQYRINILKTWL